MTHDEIALAAILAKCGALDGDPAAIRAATSAAKSYAELVIGNRDGQIRALRAQLTHRNSLLRARKNEILRLAGKKKQEAQQ